MKKMLLVTVMAVGLSAAQSQGDLLAYEGFDQDTNTNFTGSNGGIGWGGAWAGSTGDASIRADRALSYTDGNSDELPVVGFGAHINRTSRSVNRNFDTTYNSGVLWFSVLYQPLLPGEDGYNPDVNSHNVRLRDGTSNRLTIGKASGSANTNWRVNGVDTGVSATNTDLQFFLVRYDFGTGADGTIHVWMNPLLASEPDPGDAVVALTDLSAASMTFGNIIFDAPPGNLPSFDPQIGFDEIRVASDFFNAVGVPEPASLALLGLGGLVMLSYRRR